MKFNLLNKIPNSVFLKLLFVLIITGLCINVVVGIFFNHALKYSPQSTFQKYLNHYVDSIIKDLGIPPDLEKAKKIAKLSAIEIRYESQDLNWSTIENFPKLRKNYRFDRNTDQKIHTLRSHGKIFITVKQDNGRFVFLLEPFIWQKDVKKKLVLLLIVLLTGILAGAYFAIQRILNPVKGLTEAVHQIAQGNLKHRVPVEKSDELGRLAKGFNNMTDRIREMVRAKEQLLLDVSHELRSPLTRMKVALERIPEGKTRDSIKDDILEMERMVTELLEEARLRTKHGHLELNNTDLVKLIRSIATLFTEQPPGIEIKHVPSTLILKMDEEKIKSVLNNVINNALKYSTISQKPVEIELEQKDGYIVVHIMDFGMGIPPEDIPHIFEPFYRVDKSRSKHTGGYGLGLNLCRTIMEAHNGKIEVDSSLGRGTTVSLYFPDTRYEKIK
ncbi:MAG: ATP-binding protein [Desulfobacterales bacterium]|nr:ATP-binding protein [Desulfobacterales bacterium]